MVEPLFLSNPDDAELASRPHHIEALAQALLRGLTAYVTRAS